jgi:hypothetical protein
MTSSLRPRDLFDAGFRRHIRRSLGLKPLLLLGPVAAGAEDLARAEVEFAKNAVLLRPTIGASAEEIAISIVTQVVFRIDPNGAKAFEGDDPGVHRARRRLARRYGGDTPWALEIARGERSRDWSIARAVGSGEQASIRPLLIAIANVHRVPAAMLWELRDLANAGRVLLVATTHPEPATNVVGVDAPLYGNATVIDVPPVEPRMWERSLSEALHRADIEFLRAVTRGRAESTIEILSFLTPDGSVRSAWLSAVEARRREAESVLNLAAAVHDYAPRLLLTVAGQRAPYRAIPGAPSQRIARALGKLREFELIEQPTPRQWQIADPVLQVALLAHTPSALRSEALDPFGLELRTRS